MKDIDTVINEEFSNAKASLGKFPEEAILLNSLLRLYKSLPSNLKTYPRDQVPVLQMFWMCLRGYLISSKLLFEAHIPESYAILSRSAEAVASARKMAMNPEKIEGWIKREKETGQNFRRILGELFPKKDKILSPKILEIYQLSSEHGRHPTFNSTIFFSNFKMMNSENRVEFIYCDIGDELNLRRSINYLIYCYYEFMIVFIHIFKKYLKQHWLDEFMVFEDLFDHHRNKLRDIFEIEAK